MNILTRYTFQIIFLLLLGSKVESQNNTLSFDDQLPQEKILLTTDRDLFIVGESALISIALLTDNIPSNPLSSVAYVELFDERKTPLIRKQFKLSKGRSTGEFLIPDNLRSGYYFLRTFTNYSRNFDENFGYNKLIKIINPETQGRSIVIDSTSNAFERIDSIPSEPKIDSKIEIVLDQNTFKTRDKVSMQLDNVSLLQNYSITVRHANTNIRRDHQYLSILELNPWLTNDLSRKYKYHNGGLIEPEYRGAKINGIVRDKTTFSPLVLKVCQLSVLGEETQVHLAMTDEDGRFEFITNDIYGRKKLHIGLQNEQTERAEILVNNYEGLAYPPIIPTLLRASKDEHTFFESLYQNTQLDKGQRPDIIEAKTVSNITQFDNTNSTIDFISFDDVEDLVTEIIPFVSVRVIESVKKIVVFDPEKQISRNQPLVLLDKVPVHNFDALLAIKAADIEKVEVIHSKYYLGEYPIDGIVSFTSMNRDFAGYEFPAHTAIFDLDLIEEPRIFQSKKYNDQNIKSRVPDLRSTLYWLPNNADESLTTYSFFTSDLVGPFEIVIEGFDKEGNFVRSISNFIVEK